MLFAIIWFTLGWRKPTNVIPLKSLRKFANLSEKALYEARKRLVALKLIRIREQTPTRDTHGTTRQGHTEYTVLLEPKPYEPLPYDLVETFAPQLSGPELVLWLVVIRQEINDLPWFAGIPKLTELTGYKATVIKDARNSLLMRGLIGGYRGFREAPTVAGYWTLIPPVRPDPHRRWAALPYLDLWYRLHEQQLSHTDSSTSLRLTPKEAAFLSNVYVQSPNAFLSAADSVICRLANEGRVHDYKSDLMGLANKLNKCFRVEMALAQSRSAPRHGFNGGSRPLQRQESHWEPEESDHDRLERRYLEAIENEHLDEFEHEHEHEFEWSFQ